MSSVWIWKKDVIALCNRLSKKFGFENLTFLHGDIAGYEGVDQVDMVVTLHACDTATDYALAKAVKWGAKVILSVPCCQHEINKQIQNDLLSPVLQYGLLKERMSALLTDGIRGQLLEMSGYRTQILEFIDMEHTPEKHHDPCDPPGQESRRGGIRDNDEGIACEADVVWVVGGGRGVGNLESTFMGVDNAGQL